MKKWLIFPLMAVAVLSMLSAGLAEGIPLPKVEEGTFIQAHSLPQMQRMSDEDVELYLKPLQVMQKFDLLGLTWADYLIPEQRLGELYDKFGDVGDRAWQEVSFDGTTAGALNEFMRQNAGKKIVVAADALEVGESIVVPDQTWLAGDRTRLTGGGDFAAFRLDRADGAAISGFIMDGGFEYGVYASDSKNVTVADCVFQNLARKPVVFVGDCEDISVLRNRAEGNGHGGLYFNGNIARALVEGNVIIDNGGTSNWMAGIVLTAIDVSEDNDIYAPFGPDLHFPAEQRLLTMLKAPHDVVLRDNRVIDNNSSGVYCDGPYRVYIIENRIVGNDKEGMCLDYGTIATYVAQNDIQYNGNRARQTDDDLKMDFVLDHGRMEDGSANAKLPGISIDNAASNIVYDNRISNNYGSGVKMVRTAIRNIICTNQVMGNDAGENDRFHFFGIEIGNAPGDVEASNLDFTPGYENMVCRNMITGKHYAGIFLDRDSYINDIFDNGIMDATFWSIESISEKFNSCVNNFSLVQSRGIALSNNLALPVGGMVPM